MVYKMVAVWTSGRWSLSLKYNNTENFKNIDINSYFTEIKKLAVIVIINYLPFCRASGIRLYVNVISPG